MASRSGAYVHDKVRRPHGVLIVLHHDQGVADVPQMLQGFQQLVVVPLMQTDGGLVQNVQHSHEGGTDLSSQPDPLAFAAGQSAGGTSQGQIAQAYIRQKLQPGADFLHDLLGDHRHISLQAEVIHEFQLFFDAQGAEVHDAQTPYRHRPGNVRQPVAAALGAGRAGHALLQLLPGGIGLGLPEPPGDVVQNALKGLLQHPHAVAPVVSHPQLFPAGAVENYPHGLVRQLLHRNGQGEVVLLSQRLKIHPEHGIRPGTGPAGGLNGSVQNGLVPVRNHQILIRHQPEAQTHAAGAGTAGIVEGEHSRLQLRQADAAVLTGVVLGKAQLLPGFGQLDGDKTAGMIAGSLNGVRQPTAQAFFQHQPVNYQLDGVLFVLLAGDFLGQVVLDAVHPYPGEAGLFRVLEDLLMLALFPPDDGGQYQKTGSLPQRLHPVYDLVDGLTADFLAALGAVGHANPRPQKAQIIVDFRHRPHGGAGILGGSLLVNGNGRG